MFYNDGFVTRSSILEIPGVVHAFSTRLGGTSTLPHTKSMNIATGHGDSDETVAQNIDILTKYLKDSFGRQNAVCAHQIHSDRIRLVDGENCGEGVIREAGEDCDGFAVSCANVVPIVRTADCVPIIMCAERDGTTPAAAVLHAGWRGTLANIAGRGVDMLISLGARKEDIRAAIGPHIGYCCFEVGEDVYEVASRLYGKDFAMRHVRTCGKSLHADLSGINTELLQLAGVSAQNIDCSDECTCCLPDKYHSHRRTHGIRGAMGSAVALI